jgi:ankyrin repeat protein
MEEMRLTHAVHGLMCTCIQGSVHYPCIFVSLLHVQDGQTALYIASKNGHVAIVNFLLQDIQADVRICQKVWNSNSPSHCV